MLKRFTLFVLSLAFADFLRERFATAEWMLKSPGAPGERRPRR